LKIPILTIFLLAPAATAQTLQQTLPRGLDTTPGNSSTGFPFGSTSDQKWQWHYDSGQFDASGPIFIEEVYVRSVPSAPSMTFNIPSLELLMASSPTDYSVTGDGVHFGHSQTFSDNLNPDQMIVRAASGFVGTNVQPQTWTPLGLDQAFFYDPSLGEDFVLQLRQCVTFSPWSGSLDGQLGSSHQNGGNRYGDTSNCATLFSTTQNDEFVPVILIEYRPALPALSITPMAVGQLATFTIENVDTAGMARILWSTTGAGPTNTILGPVDLSPPLQISFEVYADLGGTLSFSTYVPASLSGTTFYCQAAAEHDGSLVLTNSLAIPVN